MEKNQLRALIRDILQRIDLYSVQAEELLMLTAAVESDLGKYIRQIGGPARGIFQMEPATEQDIHSNFLPFRPLLALSVSDFMAKEDNNLEWNLAYQICMARVHYFRVKEAIPSSTDVFALATYWKKYYNTPAGKGTVRKAVDAYSRLVL